MQTQFNLSGLNPHLSTSDKLTIDLDTLPAEMMQDICKAISDVARELGLTEGQSASVAEDAFSSLQTMLLAKLLASRKVF